MTDTSARLEVWVKAATGMSGAAVAVVAWLLLETVAIGKDLAAIKASRFSANDGAEVWKAIGEIKRDVAAVTKAMPSSFPLPETKLELQDLDRRIDDLEKTLARVSVKLDLSEHSSLIPDGDQEAGE